MGEPNKSWANELNGIGVVCKKGKNILKIIIIIVSLLGYWHWISLSLSLPFSLLLLVFHGDPIKSLS
jgi:hypothetical protein